MINALKRIKVINKITVCGVEEALDGGPQDIWRHQSWEDLGMVSQAENKSYKR